MKSRWWFVASVALSIGCGPAPSVHAPGEAPATSAPAASAAPPEDGPASAKPAAIAPLAPRVQLDDVTGGDPGEAKAAYLPTLTPISKCSSGGVIRIRVKSDEKSTSMKIEDSTSLDAAMRRCVLEALSTVDLDDVMSRGSPSAKSPGFSSQLTVAW